MNRTALLLAGLIHAAILLPALTHCSPPAPPRAERVKPAEHEPLQVTLLPAPKPDGTLPCADSYFGIGFTTRWGSGVVSSVAPGGPAEIAGLLVGDDVLNADDLQTWPRAGIRVALRVERNGRRMTLHATTARICYAA
jgi:predicted metalloprotease with PDZ domain